MDEIVESMNEERIFEMSQADFDKLLSSTRPLPLMYLSGGMPMVRSAQERANTFWQGLGRKMGFDWRTVAPCGKSQRHFSAIVIPQTIEDDHE